MWGARVLPGSIELGAVGAAHFGDEPAHLLAVLDARRHLDAAGHVDRPRQGGVDRVEHVKGMNVTIVTTAHADKEGKMLLDLLGMPFKK